MLPNRLARGASALKTGCIVKTVGSLTTFTLGAALGGAKDSLSIATAVTDDSGTGLSLAKAGSVEVSAVFPGETGLFATAAVLADSFSAAVSVAGTDTGSGAPVVGRASFERGAVARSEVAGAGDVSGEGSLTVKFAWHVAVNRWARRPLSLTSAVTT